MNLNLFDIFNVCLGLASLFVGLGVSNKILLKIQTFKLTNFTLLSYYVQLDISFYLTMETSLCGVLTYLLDRLCDSDHLLVDQDLLCLESVRDVLGGYSTEDLTVLVSFYFYLDYGLSQLSLQCLSISEDLSCFVSLLFEVLCQLFLVALVCDDSNLLRQKIAIIFPFN